MVDTEIRRCSARLLAGTDLAARSELVVATLDLVEAGIRRAVEPVRFSSLEEEAPLGFPPDPDFERSLVKRFFSEVLSAEDKLRELATSPTSSSALVRDWAKRFAQTALDSEVRQLAGLLASRQGREEDASARQRLIALCEPRARRAIETTFARYQDTTATRLPIDPEEVAGLFIEKLVSPAYLTHLANAMRPMGHLVTSAKHFLIDHLRRDSGIAIVDFEDDESAGESAQPESGEPFPEAEGRAAGWESAFRDLPPLKRVLLKLSFGRVVLDLEELGELARHRSVPGEQICAEFTKRIERLDGREQLLREEVGTRLAARRRLVDRRARVEAVILAVDGQPEEERSEVGVQGLDSDDALRALSPAERAWYLSWLDKKIEFQDEKLRKLSETLGDPLLRCPDRIEVAVLFGAVAADAGKSEKETKANTTWTDARRLREQLQDRSKEWSRNGNHGIADDGVGEEDLDGD